MHEAGAIGAKTREGSEFRSACPKLRLAEGRCLRLLAVEAEHPARAAWLLSLPLASLEEGDEVRAPKNERINAFDCVEAISVPCSNGCRRRAGHFRRLAHIIGSQPLDAASGVPPVSHPSAPQAFHQRSNILDAPCSCSRADFDRFGKPAISHALPPSRLADRDDRRNRRVSARVAYDLRKTKITDFGKLVHIGSLLSKSRWSNPEATNKRKIAGRVEKTLGRLSPVSAYSENLGWPTLEGYIVVELL